MLDSWHAYIMAQAPAPTLPASPARRVVCFNTDGRTAASGSISPAQYRGYLRKTSGTGVVEEFQEVSILVDSGSQQEPLCSTALAQRLGLQGTFSSYAVSHTVFRELPCFLDCPNPAVQTYYTHIPRAIPDGYNQNYTVTSLASLSHHTRSAATGEARGAGAIRHLQKLVRQKRASARSRPSSSLRAGVVDTKQVLTHKQHNRDPRR